MGFWGNWQKPAESENSYQSQLFLIPVAAGQERNFTPFLFQIQTLGNLILGTHWLLILSLPGIAIAFLSCVLRTWLGFLPAGTCRLLVLRYGGSSTIRPQNMVGQKCGLYPICSLSTVASSQRNCPSISFFWLSLGVALHLGRVVYFGVVQYCQE